MRYLAIDFGTKRTGLAICDAGELIASPLTVFEGQKNLLKKIIEVVKTENVQAVLLGLPLNMDGSEGPQAELVRKFSNQLEKHLTLPIYFQDERLSTFEAKQKLANLKLTENKTREMLDAVAAAEILQEFLDSKNS